MIGLVIVNVASEAQINDCLALDDQFNPLRANRALERMSNITLFNLEGNENMARILIPIEVSIDVPLLDLLLDFFEFGWLWQLSYFVDVSIEFFALIHEHCFLHQYCEPLVSLARMLILPLWLDWVCFLN